MKMDLIAIQVARLGCVYPAGLTVREMKRMGFLIDDFIPAHAVYEPKRPDHNIVRRSEVADPDYAFAWTARVGFWEELAREIDRQILSELLDCEVRDEQH